MYSLYKITFRTTYYDALQDVREKNQIIDWIKFFLTASIETAKSAKIKFKNAVEQVEKYNNYLMKKNTNTESLKKILKILYSYPVIKTTDLSTITGLTIQTINKSVKILCDDKILVEITGQKRNRTFALIDYINIFRN